MTNELQRFNDKYLAGVTVANDPIQTTAERHFVWGVLLLASHIDGLKHFLQYLTPMTPEDFQEHWQYSEQLLRHTKNLFDYLHPRKLKEGYTPDDQEVITYVRNSCVKLGAFRQEILSRYNKQPAFTKIPGLSLQDRLSNWLVNCVGQEAALDKNERDARFLEEAIELMQARGRTKEEIMTMVDHVYSRPVGEVNQEIAGTLLTLMAVGAADEVDILELGEKEYRRVISKIDQVRTKQLTKVRFTTN